MQFILQKKIGYALFLIVVILIIVFIVKTLGFDKEPIFNTDNHLTDDQLKDQIGQMIMIGFRGTEAKEAYEIIKDVKVGSVILSDYDVPSKSFPRNITSPEQTKKLISDLQNYSIIPLFVAVDAEGGSINRLKEKYGFLKISSPEKMAQEGTTAVESEKLAKELKNLGFNMNLAPVVDLNINPQNPIIGALGRSFSSDPNEVIDNAKIFIENHVNNNIVTVAKHFPGHGSALEDSHLGLTDVTDTYKEEELLPYKKLNEGELLKAVMTAHIVNRNIDDKPATLSKVFLQDILRDQIGFKGVIISDDIQMAAISNKYGFNEAVISAIDAGCDIINVYNNSPVEYDKDLAYKTRDLIFNAVKEKKIDEKRITESYNRILDLKKQFKITQFLKERAEIIENKNFELIGMPDSVTFKRALDAANYASQITKVRSAFILAISQQELSLVKDYGMCYVADLKTGAGTKKVNGKKLEKVMHPTRDMQNYLDITKELKKDPFKTLVTCPMEYGWGGAMGPADFIPSTWMRYQDKIKTITGNPADPWNIQDSFLATGLYSADSGAASEDSNGEKNAAMIYFSNTTNPIYSWYAEGVLKIASEMQENIDLTEAAESLID